MANCFIIKSVESCVWHFVYFSHALLRTDIFYAMYEVCHDSSGVVGLLVMEDVVMKVLSSSNGEFIDKIIMD